MNVKKLRTYFFAALCLPTIVLYASQEPRIDIRTLIFTCNGVFIKEFYSDDTVDQTLCYDKPARSGCIVSIVKSKCQEEIDVLETKYLVNGTIEIKQLDETGKFVTTINDYNDNNDNHIKSNLEAITSLTVEVSKLDYNDSDNYNQILSTLTAITALTAKLRKLTQFNN